MQWTDLLCIVGIVGVNMRMDDELACRPACEMNVARSSHYFQVELAAEAECPIEIGLCRRIGLFDERVPAECELEAVEHGIEFAARPVSRAVGRVPARAVLLIG